MSVIVLHAELAPDAAAPWQSALLQALPYAKRLQLERRDAAARSSSLTGIALALFGAAQLRQASTGIRELSFTEDGKPAFGRGPWFSVAHAGMYVCCALSQDVDPGIDIEMCVGENDSPQLKKLQHWTAIEATLKAAGQGLRHARDVELAADRTSAVFLGVHYLLQPLALGPALVCTLALPAAQQVSISAIDLAAPGFSAALQRSFSLGSQG